MRTLAVRLLAIACSAVIISNAWALGDELAIKAGQEFFPQSTERETRLDAALDQQLSISFQETPLADVAAWFSSKLETPVILDHRSLEDAGIGSDTPVTRKVDGISARAALKLLLDDMDVTYLEQDGALLITTQDNAETELVTRVYPVGDLTPLVTRTVGNRRGGGMMGGGVPGSTGVSGTNSGGGATSAGGGGTGQFSVADEPVAEQPSSGSNATVEANPKAAPAQMVPDFDSLIQVITTTVRPQTWDEVGGPGSVKAMPAAKSIVVSQTREVHDEILELLHALRAAKQVGETVDVK